MFIYLNNKKGIQRKKSKKCLYIYDFITESWDYKKSISKSDPILFNDCGNKENYTSGKMLILREKNYLWIIQIYNINNSYYYILIVYVHFNRI